MLLKWIKSTYNNPPVFITENGFSDNGDLDDQGRVSYYNGYIDEVLKGKLINPCEWQVDLEGHAFQTYLPTSTTTKYVVVTLLPCIVKTQWPLPCKKWK